MILHSSTNLRNRVNKLYLPNTKSLLPLFEVVSNGVHAIEEINKIDGEKVKGKIIIDVIRRGDIKALLDVDDIEEYPIVSFKVSDNGVGLNEENIKSFAEFDSEKKASIGGKGVGRLFCLKAFDQLRVESIYRKDSILYKRKFEYKKTKDGFDKHVEEETKNGKPGTIIFLDSYAEVYEKKVPRSILEIAREIVTHFQLYFIQQIEPEIVIRNQDNSEVNLTTLFDHEFESKILDDKFVMLAEKFRIFISKSFKAKSHKLHYCAHQRAVKDEGISKYLGDLKFAIKDDETSEGFFFQVFVVGDFLDRNVNEARSGFNFSLEDSEDDSKDISLAQIRREVIEKVEGLLSDILGRVRKEKMDFYLPIVESDFPNYNAVINFNRNKVERLPVGLTKAELDLKLYEIESDWRIEVKSKGIDLLEKKKDITTLEEYKELYASFLSEFNSVGQSDLARYVVHRRAVIDLLDGLIELNDDDEFSNEDIVHSLFFPIQETSKTVVSEKQNLWLLDERLTFNSLLASDKLFKQVDELNSDSARRMDIVVRNEVFENASLFSEEKYPYESFTIIEFKKPERDNYVQGDRKKDPIKQVRSYINEILEGKKKIRGKANLASVDTPFYCYIVADITDSLLDILNYENFNKTPDGQGYFKFYDHKSSKSYIEVLPFKKVIQDAKERNKVLFDRLKLS